MNKNIQLPPISDIFQSGVADPFTPRSTHPYSSQHSPYYRQEQFHTMAPRGLYAWTHAMPPPMHVLPKHNSAPYYYVSQPGSRSSVSSESDTPLEGSPTQALHTKRAKTRNNLPKATTYILLKWLNEHLSNPYPNSFEKTQLMVSTGLNQQQLSNWFINARRRKIKNLRNSQSEKMTE